MTDRNPKRLTKTKGKRGCAVDDYALINSDAPLGVEAMVRRLLNEPGFAGFFRHQLWQANQGVIDAIKSVESYYSGPTPSELEELGIPKKDAPGCRKCTDNTRFILGAAFYGWVPGGRKKG
jgi:hypothetical protein